MNFENRIAKKKTQPIVNSKDETEGLKRAFRFVGEEKKICRFIKTGESQATG